MNGRVISPDRRWPFAYVDDLDAPALSSDARHHLERVRRLRAGDPLTVGDGAGRFRVVRFGADLVVEGDIVAAAPDTHQVTVAFALTKGDKPELVVQKLVEIGVHRIAPFTAERSVVRWDADKAARNVERWRVIAREAAAQAHRPTLAEVTDVLGFAAVAALPGAALADPDGDALEPGRDTVVVVGPEGGWSPAEEAAVTRRVRLGRHILRAETAAIVAGALAIG